MQQSHFLADAKFVAVCDPGVRTFATVYDPKRGVYLEFGAGFATAVTAKLLEIDRLISMAKRSKLLTKGKKAKRRFGTSGESDLPAARRKKIEVKIERLRRRVRRQTTELHNRVAVLLSRYYDVVLWPTFEVSGMVLRAARKLHSKTVRQMLGLAHGRYQVQLRHVAQRYGTLVVAVGEAYTSKTCTRCGTVKANLGGSKLLLCGQCNARFHRDLNGAKGILLRNANLVRPLFRNWR
jgi:putative transposase